MMELSYRRHRFPPVVIQQSARRAWARYLLRNGPELGIEVRTGDRTAATAAPSPPERSMALGRDGCSDRLQADVPLAGRRPRRRGPRHAGPESPQQPGGVAADAQAS